LDSEEFRKWSHVAAERGADDRPVRARTQPGVIAGAIMDPAASMN
jgi:hypothetical protein